DLSHSVKPVSPASSTGWPALYTWRSTDPRRYRACSWAVRMSPICAGQGLRRGLWARGEAVIMSRAGDTAIAAEVQYRRRVAVDVILLLMRNGRILLRERAN